MTTQEEYASVLANLHETPLTFLTPDEIAALQEIANGMNRLCGRLYAIALACEERTAIATMPQRCKDCADISLCPEWTFLPKYQATGEYRDGAHSCSINNIPDANGVIRVNECLSKIGRRGHSGDNPIGSIIRDFDSLTGKIMRLTRIGSLQTTEARSILHSSLRLSSDGNIHGRIDKSIDTNNYL